MPRPALHSFLASGANHIAGSLRHTHLKAGGGQAETNHIRNEYTVAFKKEFVSVATSRLEITIRIRKRVINALRLTSISDKCKYRGLEQRHSLV